MSRDLTKNAWQPEFVRSKGCRDCGKRIFYNIAKHEWSENDDLKIRHNCEKFQPRPRDEVTEAILDKITLLEHKSEKSFSLLSEIRLKLNEVLSERRIDAD